MKMGTRGLVGLTCRGKRHAAYSQFDSYPNYLGQAIVQIILSLKPEESDAMAKLVEELEASSPTISYGSN